VSRLSRSLKDIGTNADRSVTYDFLLTFHSNYRPISYRFRAKRRFQSKIANCSHPRVFCARAKWVPLGIGYRRRGSKNYNDGAMPGRERCLTISSAVWIQYTNVMDGRTDRQTDRQTDEQTDTGRHTKTTLTHSVSR